MIRYRELDPVNIPLGGTSLIEAGAGTGKTYTISSLFIRLILEKGLSVDKILVVTFTKAATEELRDRIRKRLREGIEAFMRGDHQDRFLRALVKRHDNPDRPLRNLRLALRDFDEAAIFTTHGFCQRALFENAFETGYPFNTELVTDEENLREETVHDFWRRHLYRADPEFVNYLLSKGYSPASFSRRLKGALVHPGLRIIPEIKTLEIKTLEPFRKRVQSLRNAWPKGRDAVRERLMDAGINGRLYGTVTPQPEGYSRRHLVVSELLANLDRLVSSKSNVFPLFQGFERLTFSHLAASMKKAQAPPDHEIFHICDDIAEKALALEQEMERATLFLRGEIFRYVKLELSSKKQRLNVRSFDDLLVDTKRALHFKGGPAFLKGLRGKYKAALIDEFQDTDPIQHNIFSTIFGTEDGLLFLIGDPKQAIYGFRGADVFTYIKAAGSIADRYTLRKNWRSESGLITSINTIFSRNDRPFLYEEIPYSNASPGSEKSLELLSIDGKREAPLKLWLLNAVGAPAKPLTKKAAREIIPGAVGAEILRLVDLGRKKKAFIGDTPLKERHIAVLVRRNRDARLIQEALAALKIPSTLFSSGNIFDSLEALEMERVLAAIIEPENEALLRAALATDMLGVTGEELERLTLEEDKWELLICRFKEYHGLWHSSGFIQMFRHMMNKEKVRTRLLMFADGERRLTNLLHLSEVLHRESLNKNRGSIGLLKWLSDQRDPNSSRLEEHQLRLESDEDAVKIVTVHKSKGLEYPVVFCPFIWDKSAIRDDEITFHDKNHELELTMDLGSVENAAHKALAEQELLAENLRLLYVAVTRAKNRCYVVWGRINGAETSALAYLLHGPPSCGPDKAVEATASRFQKLSGQDLLREVKKFIDDSKGTICLKSLSEERPDVCLTGFGETESLSCRRLRVAIQRDWKVSSFSSLVSAAPAVTELPDHDAAPLMALGTTGGSDLTEDEETLTGIFAFPRGAKAGTFLHDIMEHVDFAETDRGVTEGLVASKLEEYGYQPHWRDTIYDMIMKVLTVPLDPESKDLRLSCIPNKERLNELEFYFPLKTISPESLKGLFAANTGHQALEDFPETIGRLQFAPTRGFMKGFMDLVFRWRGRFYLVDWKSNFLGSRVEDYDQESMASAVRRHYYTLQYIIYTVALDQYLRLRLPGYSYEKHFGGVIYIFLRGVDPEKGNQFGIYRDWGHILKIK